MIDTVLILLIFYSIFDIIHILIWTYIRIRTLSLSLLLYLFFPFLFAFFSLTLLINSPANKMHNASNNNTSSDKRIRDPIDPITSLPVYRPDPQRIRHVNANHVDEYKD